jgi:preprotein translocase subunit SecG
MFSILLGLHVVICVLLILVVLLQRSRGAGLSGVFGGGGSQSVFGGRGAAPFLAKATSILAILFMTSSLSLALLSARGTTPKSAIEREMERGIPGSPPATEVVPLIPPLQEPEAGTEEPTTPQPAETQDEENPLENQ